MAQQIAPLDDVLHIMKFTNRSLVSEDISNAMKSAVTLMPLDDLASEHKDTSHFDRCRILLNAYADYLKKMGVEDSIGRTYKNFATEVSHNPSTGTDEATKYYRTWRLVLNTYQRVHRLERVSWFD